MSRLSVFLFFLACNHDKTSDSSSTDAGEGEGEGEGEDDTSSDAFDMCAWIVENTPEDVHDADAFDAWCVADGINCSSGTFVRTTHTVLDQAAELCRSSTGGPIFQIIEAYCADPDDTEIRYPGLVCSVVRDE